MKHIFLLNPAAGKGRNIPRLLPRIRAASRNTGIPYTLYETKASGDAVSLIQRCASTGETFRFYACGGDGTLNEAVHGALQHPNVEIACVPCGTGNDFVRSFGGAARFFPLEKQMRSSAHPIDVITSNTGKIAVNIVNIGFDCNVADGAQDMKQLPLVSGKLAYFLSLADEFTRPIWQNMAISTDNNSVQVGNFLLCAVGNGGYCGGGFRALPHANVSDGLLDVSTVRAMPRREILPLLPYYRTGSYLSHPAAQKYVHTERCKQVYIRTPHPVRVSFDGEIIRTDSLKLQVQPKAVRFCIPVAATHCATSPR